MKDSRNGGATCVRKSRPTEALLVDWITLDGAGAVNGAPPSLWVVNRTPQRVCVHRVEGAPIDRSRPIGQIAALARERRISTVVNFGILERVGLRRAQGLVERLRREIDGRCRTVMSGLVETVYPELVTATIPGIEVVEPARYLWRTPGVPESPASARVSRYVTDLGGPISSDVSLASVLTTLGVQDEIDVLFSHPRRSSAHEQDEGGWVVATDRETTASNLATTLVDRMDHLNCDRLLLAGDIVKTGLWDGVDDFSRWLGALRGSRPDLTFRLHVSPHEFVKANLADWHACGLTDVAICLSGSQLTLAERTSVQSLARACDEIDVPIRLTGLPIRPSQSWEQVRKAWLFCDAVGADFLEMLNCCVPYHDAADSGWLGSMWQRVPELPPLLFELRKTVLQLKLSESHDRTRTALHPSVYALYWEKLESVRDMMVRGLSRCGVFGCEKSGIHQFCRLAEAHLAGLSSSLNEPVSARASDAEPPSAQPASTKVPDVAVVVMTANNHRHLTLCAHSIAEHTDHAYDLYVMDCGSLPVVSADFPCSGTVFYERVCDSGQRSLAAAWGMRQAWHHRYVLLLNSNACALAGDWLEEMLGELEGLDDAGAIGIIGGELDYESQETSMHLRDYVLSSGWRTSLGRDPNETDHELLSRLSVKRTTRFNELTGVIQLYRGEVLRRIGVPIVDDRILKHTHWDSELSMRVLAAGYTIGKSKTASSMFKFFGQRYDSGIPGVSSYAASVRQDRSWLQNGGYEGLASRLTEAKTAGD